MTESIATVEELLPRLNWTLEEQELEAAESVLEDLSEDARHYGSPTWTALTHPPLVKSIVLRAAARYLRNPEGYTVSRAGDETVQWDAERVALSPEFTAREQATLAELAGRKPGIWTAPMKAWNPRAGGPRYVNPVTSGIDDITATGYAPAGGGSFPIYADNEGSI